MDYIFDREALQEYILVCCQSEYGGLIDKPGKGSDFYHTCYCLSGLSISQHHVEYQDRKDIQGGLRSLLWISKNEYLIIGDINNLLAATHPVHNITLKSARNMIRYFYKQQLISIEEMLPVDDEPILEI